jgi:hypothetical protein
MDGEVSSMQALPSPRHGPALPVALAALPVRMAAPLERPAARRSVVQRGLNMQRRMG